MKKLFLGTSFSGHVDYDTGQVEPEFRKKIEAILKELRANGEFEVFCAVEYEGWVIADESPAQATKKDLEELDRCDVFLAILPEDMISAGLQSEIGYAIHAKKKVIVGTLTGQEPGYYFNQGLIELGLVANFSYDNPGSLVEYLKEKL